MSIYGYFDNATQTEPKHDPGLNVPCPVCSKTLDFPMKTISLMVPTKEWERPDRSYFYRAHKRCYESLDDAGKSRVDGLIVDAIVSTRNVN